MAECSEGLESTPKLLRRSDAWLAGTNVQITESSFRLLCYARPFPARKGPKIFNRVLPDAERQGRGRYARDYTLVGGALSPTVAFYVRNGDLTMHLFDSSRRKLVRAGVAKGEVEETTKKEIEQLNNIMAKMFSKHPAVGH